MHDITIGSLFSGIGGIELGLEWAGLGPVRWQVERDEFCRRVLAKHWPDVRRYDDVCTVGADLERVDVICGGFPCQDVSSAGKRAGLAGARSGLWREFARVVGVIRPRWVVVENVASGATRWVDAVVRDLAELGYASLPIPLSASDVGAPHRRARVFIVARHADGDGKSARAIDAEMGRPPRVPPDSHSDGLRQQPAGRVGPVRKSLSGLAGGSLSPIWCEWYLGFPAGWTELASARSETPLSQCARRSSATS